MTAAAVDVFRTLPPELYINRELSLLAFNRRVLDQARDPNVPLLERLRFLCIGCTNLDEFFEIRVARLKAETATGSVQAGTDARSTMDLLGEISVETHRLVDHQYQMWNDELIPALETAGIRFLRRGELTDGQRKWVQDYFRGELLPVLSPLGLDPAHPFPRILNKSLNFIVSLKGRDAFGRQGRVAIVQAPRALPRVIPVPDDVSGGPHDFIFLSSFIHEHVRELFPGMEVTGCYQFRVTRNSELFVDEEEVDDLLRAVEGELASRRYGDAVRLEVADNCPAELSDFLREQFELEPDDLYVVNGPVNLHRLIAVTDLLNRPELKYAPFVPGMPARLTGATDIFEVIRNGDLLLHHPFESFAPVLDFVRQAAADPNVLALKQTLYRTGAKSVIVDELVKAARSGKEVTVVIELRARFDEEANIGLASRLQEAGAHVVYGVVGHKTHAKMILVVRREGKRLRHYVHLGTGNYHDRTARLYTDFGMFTCANDVGRDAHNLFLQMTSLGRVKELKKLVQAPFNLHKDLLAKIARCAEAARAGGAARIVAKMNALVEPGIIAALYDASQAGVRIDLIVRGICCLRPGIPGISDHIQVRSVVGRFLEHPRVYWFHTEGNDEVYCASADWMQRNFFQRVEVAFPIEDADLRDRVIREGLQYYLDDNSQAWIQDADGNYTRLRPGPGEAPVSAQSRLLTELAQRSQ